MDAGPSASEIALFQRHFARLGEKLEAAFACSIESTDRILKHTQKGMLFISSSYVCFFHDSLLRKDVELVCPLETLKEISIVSKRSIRFSGSEIDFTVRLRDTSELKNVHEIVTRLGKRFRDAGPRIMSMPSSADLLTELSTESVSVDEESSSTGRHMLHTMHDLYTSTPSFERLEQSRLDCAEVTFGCLNDCVIEIIEGRDLHVTEGTALGMLKERTCVPFVTLSIHETITNEEVYRTRFKASESKTNNPKWGISHKISLFCDQPFFLKFVVKSERDTGDLLIGTATVDITDIVQRGAAKIEGKTVQFDSWLPLSSKKHKTNRAGSIHVKLAISVHASRGRSSHRAAEGTQNVQPFQRICTVPESISHVSKMSRIGIVSSIYNAHLASVENSNGGGSAVTQRKAMSRNSLHNNEKFLTFLFVENALHLSNEAREISREADKSLRPSLDKTSYFTGGPLEGSKSAVSKRALRRSGDEKSHSSAQEVIMSGAMTLKQYQEQKLSEFRMKHAFHEDALSIERVVQRSFEAVGVERIDEPVIPFTETSSWKLWDEELTRTMENVRERMSSVQDLGQPLSATLEHCRRLSLLDKMDETTEPVVEPKLLRMRPVSGQISRDDHWGNGGSDPGQVKRTKKPHDRSEEKLPGAITRVKRRGNGANVSGDKRGDDVEEGVEGRSALASSGLMRQGADTSLRESAQWGAEDEELTLDESGAAPGRGRNRVKSPVVPKRKDNKKEGGVASKSEATARLTSRVGGFGDSAVYDPSHSQAHASSAGRTTYSLPTTLAPPSRVPPSPWLSPTVLVPVGALAVGVVLYIVFIGF